MVSLARAMLFCLLVLIASMLIRRVTATNVTNHSIGLTTDTGIEILLAPSR